MQNMLCFERIDSFRPNAPAVMLAMLSSSVAERVADVCRDLRKIEAFRDLDVSPRSRILIHGRYHLAARVAAAWLAQSLAIPMYGLRFDLLVMRGHDMPIALAEDLDRLAAQPCVVLFERLEAFFDSVRPAFPARYGLMLADRLRRMPNHVAVVGSIESRWRAHAFFAEAFHVHVAFDVFPREQRAALLDLLLRENGRFADALDKENVDPESIVIRAGLQGPFDILAFCTDAIRHTVCTPQRAPMEILFEESRRWWAERTEVPSALAKA